MEPPHAREVQQNSSSRIKQLFISRKGYRRGIAQEDKLFVSLQKLDVLSNLKRILPDDYSVAQQAKLFREAELIISPHGASLTNAIFSNWTSVVLIEFTPEKGNHFATFRNDLAVQRHYLMQCQSVPCEANQHCPDVWDRQIDIDVGQVTGIIESILLGKHADREDFAIRQHANEE